MVPPTPEQLIARIGALPAAAPLLHRLGDRRGIYLVGGAVRDLLLDRPPLDLDIVVEGDALALARDLGGEIRAHDRFGTGTVRLDGRSYDLATARRERYIHPGALPDVRPAGIEEDLQRRDFTVNALAVALSGPEAGHLVTVPAALEDLASGRMRVLHPASFLDDPTRLLRLARYGERLGFTAEPETAQFATSAIARGALGTVSGPRIGTELRLLAGEEDPVGALGALAPWRLDRAIHPRLSLEDPQLAHAALDLLPAGGRRDRLVLAVTARGVPARELEALLDALGFTAGDREVIVAAGTRAPAVATALQRAASASQIAAAIGAAPEEAVALAGALGPAAAAREWFERLRDVRLEITGTDLLAAGIPSGPDIGRGLAGALAAKLDGAAPDRTAELEVALASARAQS
jgi:tRNA nucleotidyltransferase (CCA-adding enzyme)